MARDVIQSRVQLLHDTEAHWQLVQSTFVPLAGEACITIDGPNRNKVKYGDGLHTWGEIMYSGDTGIAVDNKSITIEDNNYTIVGFNGAAVGQVPTKTLDGAVEWITPPECRIEKVFIGDLEHELEPTEDHEVVIPKATDSTIGVVKGSEHIGVEDDGSILLKKVPSNLITELESLATDISGILRLKPIASSDINTDQLEIVDGVLGISKVDSEIVQYKDTNAKTAIHSLEESVSDLNDTMTWKNF